MLAVKLMFINTARSSGLAIIKYFRTVNFDFNLYCYIDLAV